MAHDDLGRSRGGGVLRTERGRGRDLLLIGWTSLAAANAAAQDIERDPIRYSAAKPRNAVAPLEERLAKGTQRNSEYEGRGAVTCGRCSARSTVPISSQVLVFSKTSMQRDRISPPDAACNRL